MGAHGWVAQVMALLVAALDSSLEDGRNGELSFFRAQIKVASYNMIDRPAWSNRVGEQDLFDWSPPAVRDPTISPSIGSGAQGPNCEMMKSKRLAG